MGDFTQFPPRQKTLLDDRKLTLYAPNPNNGRAALKWMMAGMNPRITVWSGMETDKDSGKAEAKMDLKTFMAFLEILDDTIKAPPTPGESIGTKIGMGFKKDDRITQISDLHVGRDKDGVIFISVIAKNGNTPIKFPFTTEEYHGFRHHGGEAYSLAEVSVVMARAYLRILREVIPLLSKELWKEPKLQDRGNSGGYNDTNRQGGGGGYNSGNRNYRSREAAVEIDDELPDF
jgi:hypothetical protein